MSLIFQGTALRQQHLLIGKYFECTCARCSDVTEMGTYLSSAICPQCKTGYATESDKGWTCNKCDQALPSEIIGYKVQCCSDKLNAISKFFNENFYVNKLLKTLSTVRVSNLYNLFLN